MSNRVSCRCGYSDDKVIVRYLTGEISDDKLLASDPSLSVNQIQTRPLVGCGPDSQSYPQCSSSTPHVHTPHSVRPLTIDANRDGRHRLVHHGLPLHAFDATARRCPLRTLLIGARVSCVIGCRVSATSGGKWSVKSYPVRTCILRSTYKAYKRLIPATDSYSLYELDTCRKWRRPPRRSRSTSL